MLSAPLAALARDCVAIMGERAPVEALLAQALAQLPNCKHLFVLDAQGHQFIANVTRDGLDEAHLGRNRLDRPYMQNLDEEGDLTLSAGYISRNTKRPMLTAVQLVRAANGSVIGYVGADFDLRELPGIKGLYPETQVWRQIKGDPAIRGGLFAQQRAQSLMDERLDDIWPLMTELMTEHGVFQGQTPLFQLPRDDLAGG